MIGPYDLNDRKKGYSGLARDYNELLHKDSSTRLRSFGNRYDVLSQRSQDAFKSADKLEKIANQL
ncbi:hypothetical protein J4226_01320 [Candidatus Pacearchaeota archaeon]|nr:hypothetical protein [Candidatus Pacearchaeota archaeon]